MNLRALWILNLIFVLISSLFIISGCSPKQEDIIKNFFDLRVSGDYKAAYELLSDKTKKNIAYEKFEKYCFMYKVVEYRQFPAENGFIKVTYKFYDKKLKKGSGELYTFYITDNAEFISFDSDRIVFPQPYFLDLREAVEEKNILKAEQSVAKMLELSPKQVEALETAKAMELVH